MLSSTLLLATLFILTRPICVAAANVKTPTTVTNIHHTHIFHQTEPQTTTSSILSNIIQLYQENEEESLLDIDMTSTQLNDDAAISFMEGLLPIILTSKSSNDKEEKEKVDDDNDDSTSQQTARIERLVLAMNKLTPLGVSTIFDMLLTQHEKKKEDEEGGSADHEVDNNIDGVGIVNSTATDSNDESSNDTLDGGDHQATTSRVASSATITQDPINLIDELDLSFNNLHSQYRLLDSVRRLFEGGNDTNNCKDGVGMATLVPRVLIMESCGLGPAFCRSVGRVSVVVSLIWYGSLY